MLTTNQIEKTHALHAMQSGKSYDAPALATTTIAAQEPEHTISWGDSEYVTSGSYQPGPVSTNRDQTSYYLHHSVFDALGAFAFLGTVKEHGCPYI